jgi:hypothetical protein
MKKNTKLWKYLFNKYANSGFTNKGASNFDQLTEKAQIIHAGEISKMLKDHNVGKEMITKEQLTALMRTINGRIIKRRDLSGLQFEGFHQFIIQASNFIYSKPPLDISHLPTVESIKALVAHFEKATRERG